ncbi:MAG: right-handed parallel beta-helix repeat-containing protein [Egibacteraceae bacterium]
MTTHVVQPGQSIQNTIDAARPGDTILVQAGVYRENLEIVKDGITLVGHAAVLEAPEVSTPRRCSTATERDENPFGICITAQLEPGLPPTVLRPVQNVTVRGFVLGRFPSTGIHVLGGHNTRIEDNELTGGDDYAVLVSRSSATRVTGNRVHGGVVAGIYVGDSPDARADVDGNVVVDAGQFGIYIRDASVGSIVGNGLTGNCVGLAFIDTTESGGVADWTARDNRIRQNDQVCVAGENEPQLSGMGVLLAGSSRVVLRDNAVLENRPENGVPIPSGGIVIMSAEPFGGSAPTSNVVQQNLVQGNSPVDVNWIHTGAGNQFLDNVCERGSRAGLCAAVGDGVPAPADDPGTVPEATGGSTDW